MHWLLDPITNHYVDFSGRATRQTFWMFILFHTLITTVLMIVGTIMFISSGNFPTIVYGALALFVLGTFLPGLAISVRRLRDAGFSGWLILIGLIPYLGGLILLVLYCLPTKVVVAVPVTEAATPVTSQPSPVTTTE